MIVKKETPSLYNSCTVRFGIGSDPEVPLFNRDGSAVTADRFLKELAEIGKDTKNKPDAYADGFVAELCPKPQTCRSLHANHIGACLIQLHKELEDKDISFAAKSCFKVDQKELDLASERAKKFGCDPSHSGYDNLIKMKDPRKVDGEKHKKRYAGGHIHMGDSEIYYGKKCLHKNAETVARLCDLFAGIPAVLLDRSPESKERRKMYGRAGEYRLPPHGFEYRVLSNFWMKDPALAMFCMGTVRFASSLVANIEKNKELIKFLDNNLDWDLIVEAINENSFSKAQKVWSDYTRPMLLTLTNYDSYYFDLTPLNISLFEWVVNKGIDYFFNKPMLEAWKIKGQSKNSLHNAGHFYSGWSHYFGGLFTTQRKELLDYIKFRRNLRKRGYSVPGNDDYSLVDHIYRF